MWQENEFLYVAKWLLQCRLGSWLQKLGRWRVFPYVTTYFNDFPIIFAPLTSVRFSPIRAGVFIQTNPFSPLAFSFLFGPPFPKSEWCWKGQERYIKLIDLRFASATQIDSMKGHTD